MQIELRSRMWVKRVFSRMSAFEWISDDGSKQHSIEPQSFDGTPLGIYDADGVLILFTTIGIVKLPHQGAEVFVRYDTIRHFDACLLEDGNKHTATGIILILQSNEHIFLPFNRYAKEVTESLFFCDAWMALVFFRGLLRVA